MAVKTSCIEHPSSQRLVVIREDYCNLFAGDHCAAAVLNVFEFLTNSEIARRQMAEEPGEPWIKASMSRIVDFLMNHYERSSVQIRIDRLIRHRILVERQQRLGKIKEYLLCVENINSLLRKYSVIADFSDDTSLKTDYVEAPSSLPTSLPTSLKTDYVDRHLNLKEEKNEERGQNNPPYLLSSPLGVPSSAIPEPSAELGANPPPFRRTPSLDAADDSVYNSVFMDTAETSTTWDVGAMAKFVRGRLNRERGVKVSLPDVRRAIEQLQDLPQGQIEAAVEEFAGLDFWRSYQHKAAALCQFVREWSPEESGDARREVETGQGEVFDGGGTPAQPKNKTDAPESLQMPNLVLEWNRLMPEAVQVRHWNGNAPRRELAEAEADPEFRETFPQICAACQELLEVGKVKGVCFDWLFRKSKGRPNWYQVTHGLFAFAMKEQNHGSQRREPEESEARDHLLGMFAKLQP